MYSSPNLLLDYILKSNFFLFSLTNYVWIKIVKKTTYILSHKTFSLSTSLTLSWKQLLKLYALLILNKVRISNRTDAISNKVGTIYGEHYWGILSKGAFLKLKAPIKDRIIWLELLDVSSSTKWKNSFFIFLKLKITS